ncbi:MAG: TMEM43 family protein [Thermoguttaceae bacterium]|jgi:hypothetical protein
MSKETVTTSWGSRVGSAFKGILAGFIFVLIGIALLFWNEGRTIKRAKSLDATARSAVSIDPQNIDSANEGKPVHFSGDVVTSEVLSDPEFGVSLNALALKRTVVMYQWQEDTTRETRRTSGGGEETVIDYTYSKTWSSQLIDSSAFHDPGHDNPTSMPYQSQDFFAQEATIGQFTLSQDQISNLGPVVPFNVNEAASATPAGEGSGAPTKADPESPAIDTNALPTPSATNSVPYGVSTLESQYAQDLHVSDDADSVDTGVFTTDVDASNTIVPSDLKEFESGYYIGNPSRPQIGDVKISFSYVATPCPTSFVGKQQGSSLVSYGTKDGSVMLQAQGILSVDEIFEKAQSANKATAWILRFLGFLAIFIGVKMILAPAEVLADIIPFAGRIVGFGSGIVALCGTIFLGLGTIAIGWIYYRPLIGIPLIVVAVAALLYPLFRGKKTPASATQESPTQS